MPYTRKFQLVGFPDPFSLWKITSKLQLVIALLILLAIPIAASAQDTTKVASDSTIIRIMEAGDEQDVVEPKRKLVRWNEYDGKYISVRFGGGFLYDWVAFKQDAESKEQLSLDAGGKLRDLRFLVKGKFKFIKRPVTYSSGLMFDAPKNAWLFRETGIMVEVPELWGNFFIGRTKEGFSLNKVMVGYAGWTMERATMSDATVPILGDGIKWLGYLPKQRILWNIGYFIDKYNEDQAFSSYDHQFVTRLMYLPILSEPKKTVFHTGLNFRYGKVDKDTLQIRSRPEVWKSPFFVDTRQFRATHTLMAGGEIYYRQGPWLFGSEYWFQRADAPESGNPVFHGGDIVATWLITGETRAYNTVGGFFKGILPDRPIYGKNRGFGAWEAVLRVSYIDLDDAKIKGGKFWRITPMMNWHVTDNLRLEFAYGYGELDRFGLVGGTQFFQSRVQVQL